MGSQKILFVDYDACVGCELCVMRCSLEKTGTCNPARSRLQIVKQEEGGIMIPAVCRHCQEPACLSACPTEAINKSAELTILDQDLCISCGDCVAACPYDGVKMDPQEDKAIICDLCDGKPSCVEVCPTGALKFIIPDNIALAQHQNGMDNLAKVLAKLTIHKEV